MDDIGLETAIVSGCLKTTCEKGPVVADPPAPEVAPITVDFALQLIIDAWPKLNDLEQQLIINVIESATSDGRWRELRDRNTCP